MAFVVVHYTRQEIVLCVLNLTLDTNYICQNIREIILRYFKRYLLIFKGAEKETSEIRLKS